jgi:alkyl hydroperoxide reductase subunit AhpF
MSLLAPDEQDKLRQWLTEMTGPVRLLFFTQTIDCDPCVQTRRILDELPPLSDRIAIEEVNFVLEKEKASQYAVDRVPAIALLGRGANGEADKDSRIRFLGTPSGHEFMSLIQAILLVGGAASQLTAASRQRIAEVDKPVTMQVFSTPT